MHADIQEKCMTLVSNFNKIAKWPTNSSNSLPHHIKKTFGIIWHFTDKLTGMTSFGVQKINK